MTYYNISLKKIFAMLLLVTLSFFTFAYAWTVDSTHIGAQIIGKTRSSYFAGGDGSEADPFIISRANHFFNLSFLQNIGLFNNQTYYFQVSDLTGNAIEIDFSAPNVLPTNRIIEPIGNDEYPFNGVFNGNYSILKSFIVDGQGKQDIGTFGYVSSGAVISDLIIKEPIIISNPSQFLDASQFHTHNDGQVNVATGYIVGHLDEGAILSHVFVIAPTISSLLNGFSNRSQYGLIGYSEADGGNIAGGPRNQSYNFSLNANNAYNALLQAGTTYSNYFINGSGTLRLNSAIITNPSGVSVLDIAGDGNKNYPNTYSLSTLRISSTANDPDPIFLYDQMVLDNNIISSGTATYNRENIDVVGLVTFINESGSRVFNLAATKTFIAPQIGSVFQPTEYNQSIILYIKPTVDLTNLGSVTGLYSGGGNLAYNSGYSLTGTYQPNINTRRVTFAASGVSTPMNAVNALTAVTRDPITDQLIVVNPQDTVPEYYVFMLSLSNGQSRFENIEFNYVPAAINADALNSLSNVDFISDPADVLSLNNPKEDYVFTYLNFGYELTATQGVEVTTYRMPNGSFEMNLESEISDDSFFYFDVINIYAYSLVIRHNNIVIYSGSAQIIEIKIEDDNVIVVSRNI